MDASAVIVSRAWGCPGRVRTRLLGQSAPTSDRQVNKRSDCADNNDWDEQPAVVQVFYAVAGVHYFLDAV